MLSITRFAATDKGWRIFVGLVLVGAALVRVVCIFGDRLGGDDLQIYTYFARLVLDGDNPYDAPAGGPHDPKYGDNPVGELGFFAAILSIYDSRTSLRAVFVLADLATLAILAWVYLRSRWWKMHLLLFYAFNPLVLQVWTVSADDKTVLFMLIAFLLASLERGWTLAAWVAAVLLGVLKWISAYFLLPFVLMTVRWLGVARATLLSGAFLLVVTLTMVPYFPDSFTPIERRGERLELDPGHASLTNLLEAVDLYHPLIVTVFTALSILAITVLFVASRIDLRETVVLSIAAAFILLPDQGVNRTVFVALPFLLITRLSTARLVAVWLASLVSVTAAVLTTDTFRDRSADLPLGRTLADLMGPFGSMQFVVLANVFMGVVLGLYAFDRLRGRVDVEEYAYALRFGRPLVEPRPGSQSA